MKNHIIILTICILCTLLNGCEFSNKKDDIPIIVIDDDSFSQNTTPSLSDAEIEELKTSLISTLVNDNIKKSSLVPNDLEELAKLDSDAAARWEMIVDYWNKANEKGFVGGSMLPDGLPDDDSLCIVVLGYQLNTDGSMRDELIGRLETALSNLEKYPNAYVIVTGGGTASGNPSATEADCMADWLIDNGIDSNRIIIENRSKTTVENAVFSYKIMTSEYPCISDVAIITSDYHISLGCVLFNAEFLMDTSADTDNMKIVANASYDCPGHTAFSMQNQGDWLIRLYSYQ